MSVRFTPTGRAQFLAAVAYIRRENPGAAAHFRQQAEEALRRLERFPESGRVVPEFPDLPYREVVVAPYRFFTLMRPFLVKSQTAPESGFLRFFPLPGPGAVVSRFGVLA